MLLVLVRSMLLRSELLQQCIVCIQVLQICSHFREVSVSIRRAGPMLGLPYLVAISNTADPLPPFDDLPAFNSSCVTAVFDTSGDPDCHQSLCALDVLGQLQPLSSLSYQALGRLGRCLCSAADLTGIRSPAQD